jgi:hypothetical protein
LQLQKLIKKNISFSWVTNLKKKKKLIFFKLIFKYQ